MVEDRKRPSRPRARVPRVLVAIALPVVLALAPATAATLVVANKTDDTVDLIDAKSGRSTATLPTGQAPHEVAVSPDGRTAVVSDYGNREKPGSTLTVIDVAAAKVLRTVALGQDTRPHGLTWVSAERVAVTTEGSRHLLLVDPFAGAVRTRIETAQEISHMVAATPDGKRAFVANIGSGTLTAIDLVEGRKLGDVTTGEGAEGLALTPDGRFAWVANRAADTLSIVDTSSLEVVATVPCAGFPIRIAFTPDGTFALVSCARSGEVAVFEAGSRREVLRRKLDLATVPTATRRLFGDRFGSSPVPVGIVVAPDGERAWVAATQADLVVVLAPASLEVLDVLRAGQEPDGMAYSPVDVAASNVP